MIARTDIPLAPIVYTPKTGKTHELFWCLSRRCPSCRQRRHPDSFYRGDGYHGRRSAETCESCRTVTTRAA